MGFYFELFLAVAVAASSADAVEFNCNFHDHSHSVVEEIYTCRPTVTSCASTTLDDVTGFHLAGRTNTDVKALWIEGENVPFIPQGISNYFENLIALTYISNQMPSITADDLQPFPLLEHLFLYGNHLASLDGDLFLYTPRMKYIYMGLSEIEHIGYDLVTNLDDLQQLHFEENNCINKTADSRTEVIKLGLELSVLCPPLITTTTETTTTQTTTTQSTTAETTTAESTTAETTTIQSTTASTSAPTTTTQESSAPTTTHQQCSCSPKQRRKITISKSKTLTVRKCIPRNN